MHTCSASKLLEQQSQCPASNANAEIVPRQS